MSSSSSESGRGDAWSERGESGQNSGKGEEGPGKGDTDGRGETGRGGETGGRTLVMVLVMVVRSEKWDESGVVVEGKFKKSRLMLGEGFGRGRAKSEGIFLG